MLGIIKNGLVKQDLFHRRRFVAIHEIKPFLTSDKPIYVGFSILDLRKYLIYEFHYKYIKRKFNANYLFTDTDSLVYETETEEVYEDFYKDKNLFDFSDYPQYSKIFDPVNKKVIGKMKDEVKGKIISEFVGLKSKMYSLIDVDGEGNKKAKGANKNVVKNIRHEEYLDVSFNEKLIRHKMRRIQNKLHRIGTYNVCKIYLSCFDDKRYLLGDGINSLAYFHKDAKIQYNWVKSIESIKLITSSKINKVN